MPKACTWQTWGSPRAVDSRLGRPHRDGMASPPNAVAAAIELPNRITPSTAKEIATALVRAWRALWNETPPRQATLVLLAHGAFETGWWKAIHCYNLGHAKSVSGDGHCYTHFACSEVVSGKVVRFQPPPPATRFRGFRTLAEGALDYLTLLRKRFSKAWPYVLAGDPVGFAKALKEQGYYTDTLSHYTAQVVAIFRKLDKDFRDFAPTVIVEADVIGEQERQRIATQATRSVAELTREPPGEKRAHDNPEGLA